MNTPASFLMSFCSPLQVLGLGSVAVVLARSALLVVGSISASRQLHERLLTKMLRLPMSFYDAQPTGRGDGCNYVCFVQGGFAL